jgi:hypothetical protein
MHSEAVEFTILSTAGTPGDTIQEVKESRYRPNKVIFAVSLLSIALGVVFKIIGSKTGIKLTKESEV